MKAITETWRGIPTYEGIYQVSDFGNVQSLDRFDSLGHFRAGQYMAVKPDHNGYLTVHLRGGKKERVRKVHQLVLEAFVGIRPTAKHKGLHGNDDKNDNSRENLRWGTSKENSDDRNLHGNTVRGEKNGGGGILKEAQVREIKLRLSLESCPKLAREFGVSRGMIQHIKHGRAWSHL